MTPTRDHVIDPTTGQPWVMAPEGVVSIEAEAVAYAFMLDRACCEPHQTIYRARLVGLLKTPLNLDPDIDEPEGACHDSSPSADELGHWWETRGKLWLLRYWSSKGINPLTTNL